MLVVTRKPGERLLIGESVEVTVLSVRGGQVSLGVAAPREIPVHRQELLERIRRENRRAAALQPEDLAAMGASLRTRRRSASSSMMSTNLGPASGSRSASPDSKDAA